MARMLEVRRYVSAASKDVFGDWMKGLGDNRAVALLND